MTEAPDQPAPRSSAQVPSRAITALVAGLAVVLMATIIILTPQRGPQTGQARGTGGPSASLVGAGLGGSVASGAPSAQAGTTAQPSGGTGGTSGPAISSGPGGGPIASSPPGGGATARPGQTSLAPASPRPSTPGATPRPAATTPPPTHDPGAVAFVERTRSRAGMIADLAAAIDNQAAAGNWARVRELAAEMADIAVAEAFWLSTHPPAACYAEAHEDASATWPAIEGLADAIDEAARTHDRDGIESQLTVVDFAVTRLRRYARQAADC